MIAALAPGITAVDRLGRWFATIPYGLFAIGLLSLALLRTGFRWPWEPDGPFLQVVNAWPSGSGWDSSVGWLAVARLGLAASPWWELFWIGVMVAGILVVIRRCRVVLGDPWARLFLAVVVSSGIVARLTGWIGFYDQLFLLGALLVALLGPRTWWLAAIAMVSANPEMAVVAGVSAVVAGVGLQSRRTVFRGAVLAGVSLFSIGILALARLGLSPGETEDRTSLFFSNAAKSLSLHFEWFPLLASSMFMGAWLMVLLILLSPSQVWRRIVVLAGLVLLPLLFTMVTLDGTRVAVGASSVALLLGLREWLDGWARSTKEPLQGMHFTVLLALMVGLACVFPAISVLSYSPEADWIGPWRGVVQLKDAFIAG